MKKLLILFGVVFACGSGLAQSVEPSTEETFISRTTESFSQSIRSNPKHFFAYLDRFTLDNPELGPFLEYKGWISGDSHPGQWSFVPNEGKFVYTLVDFDMAGKGPLVLDFIQYALNIKAIVHQSPKSKGNKIRINTLLDSYLKGLEGETVKTPKWIRKILEKDEKSFHKTEQKYYLKKVEKDERLEVEKGFERIPDRSLEKDIVSVLGDENYFKKYEIKDVIQKRIERGGSAGQERYWILAQARNEDRVRIFELKQKQQGILPGAKFATEAMYQVYWGQKHPAYFDVDINKKSFEVRPKKISLDNTDIPYNLKSDEQWEYLEEKAIYDLYLMGRAHSSQASASDLAKLIRKDAAGLAELTKKFTEQYIEENDQN